MPVERREWAIVIGRGSTGNGRNPVINGRRQPSRGGTSRMNREVQVRICERLGVKFPGPTRQGGLPHPRRICWSIDRTLLSLTDVVTACAWGGSRDALDFRACATTPA